MSASPATPSNVDNIGPPAAKRPKPQTTPPSSMQRSQSSPAMKSSPGAAMMQPGGVAGAGLRGAPASVTGGGVVPSVVGGGGGHSGQRQPSPVAGFLCGSNTSLNDLPETNSDLIDDLCSALPPDVFSQTSANSPAQQQQQLSSSAGPGGGGSMGGRPNNGIETQHPNLTGLLTNSNMNESQQDFNGSMAFNGANQMMAQTSNNQQQMFQQQQQQTYQQTQQYSNSNGPSLTQNLPQGPNSSQGHSAGNNGSGGNNTNPFGHQIIISSQQTSGASNVITINPGVMSRSNSITGSIQTAENMHGQASTTFYQQPHFGKIEQGGSGIPEVIHVQSASGAPTAVSLAAQSGNSGNGGGAMQINMNLTQNINTGTTIINMTPPAAATGAPPHTAAPQPQHHPKLLPPGVSPQSVQPQPNQQQPQQQTQQMPPSHYVTHQQSSPRLPQYVTNSTNNPNTNTMNPSTASPQLHQTTPSNPMANANGMPSAGSTNSVDNDKRKLIQQQLILLLHAHKCNKQDPKTGGADGQVCKLPHCGTMKNVLQHLYVCQDGKACRVAHCSSSRQIIQHWKNCNRPECPVCYPLKSHDSSQNNPKKSPGGSLMGLPGTSAPGELQGNMLPMPSQSMIGDNSGQMPPQQQQAQQQQQQQMHNQRHIQNNNTMVQNNPQNMGNAMMPQAVPQGQIRPNNQAMFAPNGPRVVTESTQMGNHQMMTSPSVNQNYTGQNVNSNNINPQNPVPQQQQNNMQFMDGRQQMKVRAAGNMVNPGQQRGGLLVPGQPMVTNPGQPIASNAQAFLNVENMGNGGESLNSNQFGNVNQTMNTGNNSAMTASNAGSVVNVGGTGGPGNMANVSGAEHNQYLMAVLRKEGVERPSAHKEWHEQVKENVRCLLVYKLVETIFPNPDQVMKDKRLDNLIAYAKRVEVEMYDTAENKEDYFLRLAQKIYRIQKEIEDKRQQKRNQMNPNQLNTPQMQQPQQQQQSQQQPPPMNGDQQLMQVATSNANWIQRNEPSGLIKTEPQMGQIKAEPKSVQMMETNPAQNMRQQFPNSLDDIMNRPTNTPDSHVDNTALIQMTTSNTMVTASQQPQVVNSSSRMSAGPGSTTSSIVDKVKPEPMSPVGAGCGVSSCEQNINTSTTAVCKTESQAPTIKKEVKQEVKSEPQAPVEPGKPRNPKTFTKEELRSALWPAFQKLFMAEDAFAFKQPVDPILLGIPDYFSIIKHPMDLSTIRKHLEEGKYQNPWEFIDEVQLMFNNAWLYNRKNTRVYKSCTKLSEIFDSSIDHIMEELGYCCGHTYVFLPQMLYCYSKNSCPIPRDAKYYQWINRSPRPGLISEKYIYCSKCFQDGDPAKMTVTDEPMVPKAYSIQVEKNWFDELVNNKVEPEPFVECIDCGRKWHQICALYHENIWTSFTCEPCLRAQGTKRRDNRFIAQKLPGNKLSNFLEQRINKFTKAREPNCGHITIRVLSSSEKSLDAKMGLRSKHTEFPANFPYKSKAIFAFETIDGTDICFYGMHVQEYGTDCMPPNKRHVYLSYLDSVHYFQPKTLRTAVYHEILINYLDYCKQLGYSHAHIWACPPGEGDDYIFHCHPPDQKIPKPKRLQDWYKKMMDKAIQDRVITDYKDIMKSVEDTAGGSASFSTVDLPYFEGDFWPNTIEDLVSQMDEEEKTRKKQQADLHQHMNSDEFSDGYMDDSEYGYGVSNSSGGDKKALKANKKSKSKKGQTKSKKGSSPAADLSDRVLSTMEKHRENFFTITITPNPIVQTIEDPDPLVQCELMDGRDSFLQMAREKFWEFSSLRRTKYSSMSFLYELHVHLNDRMQYNCNNCKQVAEIRYHCNTCEDFDLCQNCHGKVTHEHELVRRTPESDAEGQNSKGSAEVNKKQAFMETLKNLPHAVTCRDANCRVRNCVRMRMIVQHAKNCMHKDQRNTCSNCKQFFQICCYHAKHCNAPKCVVPYCHNIRMKLRRQSDVLWQRRRAAMVGGASAMGTASATQSTTSAMPSATSANMASTNNNNPPQQSYQNEQHQQQQMQQTSNSIQHQQQQQNIPQKIATKPGFSNMQSPQMSNQQMQGPNIQQNPQHVAQQQSMQSTQMGANQSPAVANTAQYQQMPPQTMQGQQQTMQPQQQQHPMINSAQATVGTVQNQPQNVNQMGGMYTTNQQQPQPPQQQQQAMMVSQQQVVNTDMNPMHKQVAVSSTFGTIQRAPNMVPSGMQMQPQQQQPMLRHPNQPAQFQNRAAYVTTQQVQNPSQVIPAGANGQPRQWQQQQPQTGGPMYVVRGTGMQQMQGKPYVMTPIPRAVNPQMQQQPPMMQSTVQSGMMQGPQGTMRGASPMMLIKQGGGAPAVMGPSGPNQMMGGARNPTWQGQPATVRPTIQQFPQQNTNTMYGPPTVQQRRFNDSTPPMMQQQVGGNPIMMQQMRPMTANNSPGTNMQTGPRTAMMAPSGAPHPGQQMAPMQTQDPKNAQGQQPPQMQTADELSRFSDIL